MPQGSAPCCSSNALYFKSDVLCWALHVSRSTPKVPKVTILLCLNRSLLCRALHITVSKLLLNRFIGPEVPKIESAAVSHDMPSGL